MKLPSVCLWALLCLGTLGSANAAPYGSTEECLGAMEALDADGDGYVDKTEQGDTIVVEAAVDKDGDGRISNAEQTVACRTGAVTAVKGKDQK
jgi:hypothetical protein